MSVLDRPALTVEVAFANSPFTALDDAALLWTDISAYVEVDKGISVQRRRANELDEPSPGTLSLTLNNADGRFTRLNPSSPYFPNVKHNRLIRVRAAWDPATSANLVSRQQATSTGITHDTAGMAVPSGTLFAGPTSALSQGTPANVTYVTLLDADAFNFIAGDIIERPAASTFHRVVSLVSGGGLTDITVSPSFTSIVATGETIQRNRYRWETGIQATTGARMAVGSTAVDTAGPEAIPVTAGLTYTWSAYANRGTNAISVSPRILWYDSAGVSLSEDVGGTVALSGANTRLSLTATAPVGAAFARPSVANETIFNPTSVIAYRTGAAFTSVAGNAPTVNVPAAVQSGDALLLWVHLDTGTAVCATPAGWTAVTNRVDVNSRTYLFRKVASDTGRTFTLSLSGPGEKAVALLAAWSGTDTSNPVQQSASSAETTYQTGHVTPNVTTTAASCWIVSAAFDRTTTSSAWTQPGGDTKRVEGFTTGSAAPTGCVSDNATAVVAGTYGTKTVTANVASDEATMWTVGLKPGTASGASSGSVRLSGLQFEQASSASTWAVPSASYTRFVGHVDSWPTAWDGGIRALTTVTATDRMKLLNDQTVNAAITEQVLSTSPVIYNALNEESGATAAGNAALTSQPSIPIVSAGTVTDEMLEFGGGTGPGTDAQSALKLTPTSTTVGKALRGTLTDTIGGDDVTGISIGICFNSTIVTAGQRNVIGVDDGKPNDADAVGLLDIYFNPDLPRVRAHLRITGTTVDVNAENTSQWHDGHTHMAIATVSLSGGSYTLKLYVDGVLRDTVAGAVSVTEIPTLKRWNIGCSVADTVQSFYNGTVSHAIGWNTALTSTQISDLWSATDDAFTGDLPGPRAQRLADWAGLTSTNFEAGVEMLGPHPAVQSSLLDAFRLIARSEGGVFLVDRDGNSTLQARSHRTNASSVFTVTADQAGREMQWAEDPTLIANDVTVKWGNNELHVLPDATSQTDYGVLTAELETILATDTQALDRGNAYVTRYGQPISRPDALTFETLVQPALFSDLLPREIGDMFTVTNLPTGAPATGVDLFIEGIGEEISHESWKFSFDCSPAGFDFGLILNDAVRGLLDSNYLGW